MSRWSAFPDLTGDAFAAPPTPRLVEADGPDDVRPSWTRSEVLDLLLRRSGNLRLLRNGRVRGGPPPATHELERLVDEGWTATTTGLDQIDAELRDLAGTFEAAFGWPVTVELAASDATYLELPMATEDDDLVVIGLTGARHWEVRVPIDPAIVGAERAPTVIDAVVESGAALVIPQRWPCMPSPLDDLSIEARVRVARRAGADIEAETPWQQVARWGRLPGRGASLPSGEGPVQVTWTAPGGVVVLRGEPVRIGAAGVVIGDLSACGSVVTDLVGGASLPLERVRSAWTDAAIDALAALGIIELTRGPGR